MTENYNNGPETFIVCLDDDKDFLNSLKITLPSKFRDQWNYNLLFLDSPYQTLELLKDLVSNKEEIALLMTDQMMPEMKGIEFLKAAREITPNSMRVLLTGYAGTESAVVAINENLLHKYLTKPITDTDDFIVTLQRLLNEFHLQHTVETQKRTILNLHEFSNTLNALGTMDDILSHTVDFAHQVLQCERISILLVEEGYLIYKAGIGISEDVTARIRIPVGEEIAGSVFQKRTPLLVKDINDIPWLKKKINPDFKSFMSVPVVSAELISSDAPLGVINVTNKIGDNAFSDDDLRIITFIASSASIAINNRQNVQKLLQSYLDIVESLITALEAKDQYTKGHSLRVMKYAIGIAEHMKVDQQMLKLIKDAAILHDLGKIGVRDGILLKAGSLSSEEMNEIRKHPELSGAIVKSITSLKEVSMVVRQHHERYDGKGYPEGVQGEKIHFAARIMAVADSFDAMTSDRPYRKALDMNDARQELQNGKGTQFDPMCVEAMLQYLGEYKAGEDNLQ